MLCRLRAANIDVILSRSFETYAPGIAFGILGTYNGFQGNIIDVNIPSSLIEFQEDAQDEDAVGVQSLRGEKIDYWIVVSGNDALVCHCLALEDL